MSWSSIAADAPGAPGPPMSKTAYVLARLRDEIAEGTVVPGDQLRQAELAERYGVSPTPVREALRLLESEGVISYSPHRGATVAELSPQSINDLYLLRAAAESLVTRLAVARATDAQVRQIREVHERLAQPTREFSGQDLSRLNREFHFAIYEGGSELIAGHIATLWRTIPPRITMWTDPERAATFVSQHETILEAIEARDAEAAARLMEQHIGRASEFRVQLHRAPSGEV